MLIIPKIFKKTNIINKHAILFSIILLFSSLVMANIDVNDLLNVGIVYVRKPSQSEIKSYTLAQLQEQHANYAQYYFFGYLHYSRKAKAGSGSPYTKELLDQFIDYRIALPEQELRSDMITFYYEANGVEKINDKLFKVLDPMVSKWETDNLGKPKVKALKPLNTPKDIEKISFNPPKPSSVQPTVVVTEKKGIDILSLVLGFACGILISVISYQSFFRKKNVSQA